MNRNELITSVQDKLKDEGIAMSKDAISKTFNALVETVIETVKADDSVAIGGLGTFSKGFRKGHEYINPQTGERGMSKDKTFLQFKASAATKKELN